MDTRNSATNKKDRFLSRLGGAYLFWMNFLYLLVINLTGSLGILYISFATDLNFPRFLSWFCSWEFFPLYQI